MGMYEAEGERTASPDQIVYRKRRRVLPAHHGEPSAPADTVPAPTPRPGYAYRVDRLDEPEPKMLSYGTADREDWAAKSVADVQSAASRFGHSYGGPLRVYVWPHRGYDTEHYRAPVPEDAAVFDFGPQTPEEALEARIFDHQDACHAIEGGPCNMACTDGISGSN